MKVKEIKAYLKQQSGVPSSEEERNKWLSCDDALEFFFNSVDGMVPIYA